ncbi:MAG: hypothetical protein JRD49_09420 [Deltaproteobacteria bacterium]|nr:hypothetical protein [Deltaproteobacteria bacterium]MBW2677776.1 hypothetical protein [Deltaproteobacteria bacterium]
MQVSQNMIRKQILMYPRQVNKIKSLAKKKNTSAAEMVRQAIDAFDPDVTVDMTESELFELAAARVKEALADTITTRKKVTAALDKLEARRP